jgi:hypothetical protein
MLFFCHFNKKLSILLLNRIIKEPSAVDLQQPVTMDHTTDPSSKVSQAADTSCGN